MISRRIPHIHRKSESRAASKRDATHRFRAERRRPYCESERVVSEGVVGEGDAMEWGVDKIRHDIGHEFV